MTVFCKKRVINIFKLLWFMQWKLDRVECPRTACCVAHCNLTRPTRHKQLFNLDTFFDKPQTKLHSRMVMFYRFKRYQRFLLDIELDWCDYLGPKTKLQPVIEAMVPFVVNNTNVIHPCPLVGHLYFTNVAMDSRGLGGFRLPAGQYRFDSDVFNPITKEIFIQTKVYMTVSASTDHGMG